MKRDLRPGETSTAKPFFTAFAEHFGEAWREFWFSPRDPFTLAAIRLLTGMVALGLYLTYLPDLEGWFGPEGLLSRDAVLQLRDAKVFSIFDYALTPTSLWTFYWLGAAAIFLFTVGLFTRVTSWLALVAFLSILHRGPAVARPVDDIVAMLMFYLCLAPSGAALSLDALLRRRKRTAPADRPIVPISWTATVATRLMQIHLTAIYVSMAISKLKWPVWWNGTAVWGLIAKSDSRLVDFTALGNPKLVYLLNAWTLAIVLYEMCFPILIWNRWTRPIMLALALPIWVGTALLTGMVSWVLIMLVANLAFVSPSFFRGSLARRSVA